MAGDSTLNLKNGLRAKCTGLDLAVMYGHNSIVLYLAWLGAD